jgi:hypothetical protein
MTMASQNVVVLAATSRYLLNRLSSWFEFINSPYSHLRHACIYALCAEDIRSALSTGGKLMS